MTVSSIYLIVNHAARLTLGVENSETRSNWRSPGPAKNLAVHQESILIGVDRMSFDLDHALACKGKDPLQAVWTFKRGQREKEVDKMVTPRQKSAGKRPKGSVPQGFFTRLVGEVSPDDRSAR